MWHIVSVISLLLGLGLTFRTFAKAARDQIALNPTLMASRYRGIAHLLEAQAKHETGNFTSRLYKEQNNLFGMGCPKHRDHKGVCRNGFLHYNSKADSIADMVTYLKYVSFPVVTSLEDYVRELKARNYFTDSLQNYEAGLRRFL